MRRNTKLKSLNPALLDLEHLKNVDVDDCSSLQEPPLEVAKQGVRAIQLYYQQLVDKKTVPLCTIVTLGNTGAGKTSLARSLESRSRVTTGPNESTRVVDHHAFRMDDGNVVTITDLAGQDLYHYSYQISLRSSLIPIYTVDLHRFHNAVKQGDAPTAVARHLCFDWLSHCHHTCPQVGTPFLALTHCEQLIGEPNWMEETTTNFMRALQTLKTETKQDVDIIQGDSQVPGPIGDLLSKPQLFQSDHTFHLSNNDLAPVLKIASSLAEEIASDRIKKQTLPGKWRDTMKVIKESPMPFLLRGDVINICREVVGSDDAEQTATIILNVLHQTGQILWVSDCQEIADLIFHNLDIITKLIETLFSHVTGVRDTSHFTTQRVELPTGPVIVQAHQLLAAISELKKTGVVSESVLMALASNANPLIPAAMSLHVLKSFHLIHGPIQDGNAGIYLVPSFASRTINQDRSDTYLPLETKIKLFGIVIPDYVIHELTAIALEQFPEATTEKRLYKNGAEVYKDGVTITLQHDNDLIHLTAWFNLKDAESFFNAWRNAGIIYDAMKAYLKEIYPGLIVQGMALCSHCKFVSPNKAPEKREIDSVLMIAANPGQAERSEHRSRWEQAVQDSPITVKCGDEVEVPSLLTHCPSESFDATPYLTTIHQEKDSFLVWTCDLSISGITDPTKKEKLKKALEVYIKEHKATYVTRMGRVKQSGGSTISVLARNSPSGRTFSVSWCPGHKLSSGCL